MNAASMVIITARTMLYDSSCAVPTPIDCFITATTTLPGIKIILRVLTIEEPGTKLAALATHRARRESMLHVHAQLLWRRLWRSTLFKLAAKQRDIQTDAMANNYRRISQPAITHVTTFRWRRDLFELAAREQVPETAKLNRWKNSGCCQHVWASSSTPDSSRISSNG